MLRNKEFKMFISTIIGLGSSLSVIAWVFEPVAGIFTFMTTLCFSLIIIYFTRQRYRDIAQVTTVITQALQGEADLDLSSFEEGELSILQHEVTKMIRRLREQNMVLKKEKVYLADSLADIAHQLRTPLTSANLISNFLATTDDLKERQKFSYELASVLERMDWLITTLLKISRLDAAFVHFQMQPIMMRDLLDLSSRSLLIPLEIRNVTLSIEGSQDSEIEGDIDWLAEALQNLLKNCMESIGHDGCITLTITDNVLFSEILIHDSGSGFAAADLPHLFDRFYRGEHATSKTGYGIGLALAHSIITRHGGALRAYNHAQGGAVFHVHLPKVTKTSFISH